MQHRAKHACVSLQSVVYCHGGRIGFYQGDIRLLPDDMKALRPTIFPVVPRLLNRMYDKVSEARQGQNTLYTLAFLFCNRTNFQPYRGGGGTGESEIREGQKILLKAKQECALCLRGRSSAKLTLR